MARCRVKMDGAKLKAMQEKIEAYGDPAKVDKFCEDCAKELAARLLRKVVKRTPTGTYPKSSGKKGGTLKRGWTGGEKQDVAAYVASLPVIKSGGSYIIEMINPTPYGLYVELGHRTRNHRGWVEGRFFVKISEQELQASAPAIIEKKLKSYLLECFG